MSAAGFLAARFAERPQAPAVAAPVGRCTFAELAAARDDCAERLRGAGVRAGTVVSLEGAFTPRGVALFLALADLQAVAVPHEVGVSSAVRLRREATAQAEVRARVEADETVGLARVSGEARHPLYGELRRRGSPGVVLFSSGTAGEPKAAVHDLTRLLEKFRRRRPALSTLAFLMFDHLGGINTMLHTLSNGATLVSAADRSPDAVCAAIERERVELLPATPTFLNLMLVGGAHRRHDLSSLRTISYGAEPMPPATLRRLGAAFPGVKLQQTYGTTEFGAMRTKSRDDGSLWVKVGGEGFETRVVDGKLEVRADAMLLGYLNADLPLSSDGFLATGDVVEVDGDYVRFLGRESDVINVGGEKVRPVEVEGVICDLPGVAGAVVYGEANALVGQVVCARVEARGDFDPTDLGREVKRHCRSRLEPFKVPVRVEVVDRLDRTERFKRHRPSAHDP